MDDALAHLHADVVEASQVVARVAQAALGFLAALAVLGDPGRFFEKAADVLGARLDDARDHALLDDRVGARTKTGAEEEVDDVLAPHVHVVDVIGRLARTVEHALDRDLGIARPLPRRLALGVVEDELHARARHRLARGGAVEDHVLHRLAAQGGGACLAQHPAHGIDDVRLAAAVRTNHADQVARGKHGSRVDESLETSEFEFGKTHVGSWAEAGAECGGEARGGPESGRAAGGWFGGRKGCA